VFGKVVKGKELADKVKAAPTARGGNYESVPQEPVTIAKAVVVQR
jgi:peptidyl-prolyl cis-trans isomerase A (cyclophilin A)